jgi:hypothetical protein
MQAGQDASIEGAYQSDDTKSMIRYSLEPTGSKRTVSPTT